MARSLNFNLNSAEYSAPIEKVDRKALYGWTEKHFYDRDGGECYFGSLSNDGVTIFGKESFESGYVNDRGEWCERSSLIAVDREGEEVVQQEASFKRSIELKEKVDIDEYLQHIAKSVYQLDAPELLEIVKQDSETIFTFPFNYTASYAPDTAFLIENDDSLFMVVGSATHFDFVEPEQTEPNLLSGEEDDEDESDDIDFSMF